MPRALLILSSAWLLAACSSSATPLLQPEEAAAPGGEPAVTSTVITSSRSNLRSEFTCTVADSWGYPYLLEGDFQDIAVDSTRPSSVCLPDDKQASEFCHWANSFDARLRALQTCFHRARANLYDVGIELLQQRWRDASAELPTAWRMKADEEEPSGGVAAWVQLLRGVRAPAAAAPFCLPAASDCAPREQVVGAMEALRWAWEMLAAEQERLSGLLRRGVQLKAGDLVVDYSVSIVGAPSSAPVGERCYF